QKMEEVHEISGRTVNGAALLAVAKAQRAEQSLPLGNYLQRLLHASGYRAYDPRCDVVQRLMHLRIEVERGGAHMLRAGVNHHGFRLAAQLPAETLKKDRPGNRGNAVGGIEPFGHQGIHDFMIRRNSEDSLLALELIGDRGPV